MDYKTEKAYKISSFVLPIISFAILCIMFLNYPILGEIEYFL